MPKNPSRTIKKDDLECKLDKTTLDFSSKDKYNLINIDILENNEYKKEYKDLFTINLDNNSLSKISIKGFNKLNTVTANKNLITNVDLNLNKLSILYLNNNLICEIPDLNFTPVLKELSLADNSITTLKANSFRPVKSTLILLDLSQNKIDFSRCEDFIETSKTLGKNMKKLLSFNIIGNPFCEKRAYNDYPIILASNFEVLVLLNKKDCLSIKKNFDIISNLEKKMISIEESTKNKIGTTPGQTNYGTNMDENINLFSNTKTEIELCDIVKKTAKLTTLGKLTITTLKELTSLVNQYLIKKKSNINSDKDNMEDPEINEFDNFLDLINILIDTSPMFEKNINYLVCDFINVKNGKFSGRIMVYLRQRIFSEKSDELQNAIMDHLERRMDFKNKTIDNISPSLFLGMETLLHNPILVNKNSFLDLTRKIIDYIIKIENLKLINCRLNEEFKKKEIYYSLITYLHTATNSQRHFIFMIENMKFLEKLSQHIKYSLNENFEHLLLDGAFVEIIIKLLGVYKNLLTLNKDYYKQIISKNENQKLNQFNPNDNLQKILSGGLREKIEQVLNIRIQEILKKNNKEKDFILNKNRIIFSLINCYGGLINISKDISKFINDETSVPYKIINLLVQSDNNDPFFICSGCEFTLLLLENEEIIKHSNNLNNFKKIVKNLYSLRYVLPYLVYDKPEYKNSCLKVEKYGQTAIIRGKPVELSSLNSSIMYDMIISIVKLIEFFGRNTKNESNLTQECKSFCKELQEQNKNYILCSCLVVPNEKVKMAIVESLYSMDCSQLKSEEIISLSKQLYDVSLSGEHIEKILSTIFIILDQCFQNFIQKRELERLKQNKEIFSLALEILLKNNERSTTFDFLYRKKLMLNCSISLFLNNCCRNEIVNIFFKDKKKSVKLYEILQAEESNLFPTEKDSKFPYYVPLEIEKLRSGYKIDNLIPLITNEYFLTPYTYISCRLMMHIADTLMNINSRKIELDIKLELDDLMRNIQFKFSEREYKRILIESLNFNQFLDYNEIQEKKLTQKEHFLFFNNKKEDLILEQEAFLKNFDVFMKYIKGETNNKMNFIYNSIWKNKLDPIFKEQITFEDDENTQKILSEEIDKMLEKCILYN